jgi:hypothetical protein
MPPVGKTTSSSLPSVLRLGGPLAVEIRTAGVPSKSPGQDDRNLNRDRNWEKRLEDPERWDGLS